MANSSVTANQSVRTIEVGANKEFLTIQEAINAASDGDSIVVYAGDYAENILINKAVTLLAAMGLRRPSSEAAPPALTTPPSRWQTARTT